jgi:hypothetical protein
LIRGLSAQQATWSAKAISDITAAMERNRRLGETGIPALRIVLGHTEQDITDPKNYSSAKIYLFGQRVVNQFWFALVSRGSLAFGVDLRYEAPTQ